MLTFPNCKINLGLYITHRRDDGYHDLETVFYPVRVTDVLEIIPAPLSGMVVTGLPVAGAEADNLVLKAWQLLKELFPERVGALAVYLHKVIPMGAGLGGGSADGAFMLTLMNEFFNLQLDRSKLADLALKLGSDCPFFIYNTPQLARGRGEKMEPVAIDLSSYSLQLICPEVHVSTRQAFSAIVPAAAVYDLSGLPQLPLASWKDNICNDFEKTVFQLHPLLAEIKKQLYDQGAIYASLTGSGSALYGIFPKNEKAAIKTTVAFHDFYIE